MMTGGWSECGHAGNMCGLWSQLTPGWQGGALRVLEVSTHPHDGMQSRSVTPGLFLKYHFTTCISCPG